MGANYTEEHEDDAEDEFILSQKIHFILCFITERLRELACSPVFATRMWGPGHTQAFLSSLARELGENEISGRARARAGY